MHNLHYLHFFILYSIISSWKSQAFFTLASLIKILDLLPFLMDTLMHDEVAAHNLKNPF
jgi:hypothetical protein